MKIIVVNLKKDIARRGYMSKMLDSLWVKYSFFDAVYGKELSQDELDSLVDYDFLKEKKISLSLGEIGCALSHYMIYKKIVNEKIDKVLIMEDDVEIDEIFFLRVLSLLEKRNDLEYVSLNYDLFDKKFRQKYLREYKNISLLHKIIKGVLIFLYRVFEVCQQLYWKKFGPVVFRMIRPLHLTWCYFVSYEWAKKILNTHWKKIRYLADFVQNEAKNKNSLRLHFISPLIVRQLNEQFDSNIR